jgi:hypothetical protein
MMMHSSPEVRAKYYNFPTSGFAYGCNLNDVISSLDPFHGLETNKSVGHNPYSVKVRYFLQSVSSALRTAFTFNSFHTIFYHILVSLLISLFEAILSF